LVRLLQNAERPAQHIIAGKALFQAWSDFIPRADIRSRVVFLADYDMALAERLEQEVIPAFYDRGPDGIPRNWVHRMRTSMAELTPRFSTNRMVREYAERLHLTAAQVYHDRSADRIGKAVLLCRQRKTL
jgi:glucan phosphorylase